MKAEKMNFLTTKNNTMRLFLSMCLFMVMGLVSLQAQCPLSCNDHIQVSLDDNCEALITPDMIMEGDIPSGCTFVVEVYDENDDVIPLATVTKDHIGGTYKVRVFLAGTINSCWTTISVEDKLPPVVVCLPDTTVSCNDIFDFDIDNFLDDATDNCSDDDKLVVDIVSDIVDDRLCDEVTYSAVRNITYVIVDEHGNRSSECTFSIFYERDEISDITYDPDYFPIAKFECGYAPASKWPTNDDGYGIPDPADSGSPEIAGNPLFPNTGYCEIQASYSDEFIPLCGNTYKVLRHWVVLDWCRPSSDTDNPSYYYQIIKVEDTTKPLISAEDEYSVNTNAYTCDANILLSKPTAVDSCSAAEDMTYQLFYKKKADGESPLTNATEAIYNTETEQFTVLSAMPDTVWVTYVVTDECGNSNTSVNEIGVIDNSDPFAVCDEFTVVSLSSDNSTWVDARSFDDGSWDNCTPQDSLCFEAKRFASANCDTIENEFAKHIQFCCKDLGEDVMVLMRVTDQNGNSSTCMVTVEVQDKNGPQWTYCPPDTTVTCGGDLAPHPLFGDDRGFATAVDNCDDVTVTWTDSSLKCGFGTMRRVWRATDGGGRFITKTQIITVEREFDDLPIVWPLDTTIVGCAIDDMSMTGEPTYADDNQCYQVAVTFTDQDFEFVEDVCVKILRRWVVIDWCIYTGVVQQDGSIDGFYDYEQVIKYTNTQAPVFAANCMDYEIVDVSGPCTAKVQLTADVDDECTPYEELEFKFQLDLNHDYTIDSVGHVGDLMIDLPYGTHFIRWFAEDRCGNVATCEREFIVRDEKDPTPYCLGGVTTVIMPSTGTIEIWASDFDRGSFDNCDQDLDFTMRRVDQPNSTLRANMTFECLDAGVHEVEIWVTDDFGNDDYCITKIDVQANQDCDQNLGVVVGGNVATEDSEMVEGVEVLMRNTSNTSETYDVTELNGEYLFNNTSSANNYELTATGSGDYINGVSTFDIVLIQRHILGLENLNSPYKIIAADANNSNTVTAADIISLRQLILGKIEELPNNESWRFVDATQTFTNNENPWPFTESIMINQLNSNDLDNNFVAVKIGDVSGDAKVNNANDVEIRSLQSVDMWTENNRFDEGEKLQIPVYFSDLSTVLGFQFTLQLEVDNLLFDGIESGVVDFTDNNINTSAASDGLIAISWENSKGIVSNDNEPLFYINTTAVRKGELAKSLEINSELIDAEIYDANLDKYELKIDTRGDVVSGSGISLYQNVPNPFNNSTKIGFYLPEANDAELTIFDITGKQIYRSSSLYKAGYNEISLDKSNIETNGILYYQLNVDGHKEMMKMIMIE